MKKRLREDVRFLNIGIKSNMETGRIELVLKGSGGDSDEFMNAIDWMEDAELEVA